MPVKFDKLQSPLSWYSLTYQSNDILNVRLTHEQHCLIKPMITKILFEEIGASDFQSHIHGTIIFSVTNAPLEKFDLIVAELTRPILTNAPPLLFSLCLIAHGNDPVLQYMHINGSDTLNAHYLNLIRDFYPRKPILTLKKPPQR